MNAVTQEREMVCEPWVQTWSGGFVDLADPKPDQIHINDIAYQLSGQPRFCNATSVPYSVAQHSVVVSIAMEQMRREAADAAVSYEIPPRWATLAKGLLHDAHEAYMGDPPGPLKVLIPQWDIVADRLQRVIEESLFAGLAPMLNDPVLERWRREADAMVLEGERRAFMMACKRPWSAHDKPIVVTEAWDAKRAKAEFMTVFYEIFRETEGR